MLANGQYLSKAVIDGPKNFSTIRIELLASNIPREKMTIESRWLLSITAAMVVPTLLPTTYFAVLSLSSTHPNENTIFIVGIVAFLVVLTHIAVLGIPGLLLLSLARQFKAWTICVLGFFFGCLPISIWSWPLKSSLRGASDSHWDGEKMVQSMVDGVPTLPGWIGYGEGVLSMGALGAVSGAAFWLAWKYIGPSNQRRVHESFTGDKNRRTAYLEDSINPPKY